MSQDTELELLKSIARQVHEKYKGVVTVKIILMCNDSVLDFRNILEISDKFSRREVTVEVNGETLVICRSVHGMKSGRYVVCEERRLSLADVDTDPVKAVFESVDELCREHDEQPF